MEDMTDKLNGHDVQCPRATDTVIKPKDCIYCYHLKLARNEELDKFNETWRVNLPLIEKRNYERGFKDGQESSQ